MSPVDLCAEGGPAVQKHWLGRRGMEMEKSKFHSLTTFRTGLLPERDPAMGRGEMAHWYPVATSPVPGVLEKGEKTFCSGSL